MVFNPINLLRNNRLTAVLGGLVLVFGAMNGLLLRQNLQLRAALRKFEPDRLKTGDVLQPFTATNLDGSSIDVSYLQNSPRRVFLFFSPHCPYCEKQFPAWKSIIREAPPRGFQVLALAGDSEDETEIKEYLKSLDCPPESESFRVVLISRDVRAKYKFTVTPTTLVVSNAGVVQSAWNGLFSAADVASASGILGIDLSTR